MVFSRLLAIEFIQAYCYSIKKMSESSLQHIFPTELENFFVHANPYRSLLLLAFSILLAYWLSKFVARLIIFIAQKVAVRSDNESNDLKALRLRQVETYLGVAIAMVRLVVVLIVAYFTWRVLSPEGSRQFGGSGAAAIGASAVFIVIAGQTMGPLLRDITAGATMIVEQWFTVGDYIKVEPFIEVSGVVERLTLRSTRLRSLSGEVIWIHNQQIHGVHVTPNGVRTMAVDVFVSSEVRGEQLVQKVIKKLPTGPMMLAKPLKVKKVEQWGDGLWMITCEGKTVPGREWLIEKYFVNALMQENDSRSNAVIINEPIVRYADPETDKRFRRAVRIAKEKHV